VRIGEKRGHISKSRLVIDELPLIHTCFKAVFLKLCETAAR